jgi:hypothetical protein
MSTSGHPRLAPSKLRGHRLGMVRDCVFYGHSFDPNRTPQYQREIIPNFLEQRNQRHRDLVKDGDQDL